MFSVQFEEKKLVLWIFILTFSGFCFIGNLEGASEEMIGISGHGAEWKDCVH